MTTQNLLVELFVEELPPKALKKLGEAFSSVLADSLKAQGLAPADAAVSAYASPRRLAVHVSGVAAQAADKAVQVKLMPVKVGLDADGKATPALLKKLGALGADASVVPQLKQQSDGKADVLLLDSIVTGATLADGLQKALDEALAKLPIPKVMGYQLKDGWSTVNFVRPAHKLVALHGADIVPIATLGLSAGRETLGHRFEAKVSPVVIRDADSYAAQLADEGAVIASFAERRAEIVRQLTAAAAVAGLKPIEDEALLDEVTALVERPNVLTGQFEAEFLEVPQECLILTMKANQKYFPLLDAAGKLTNKFLIVSNISPADPSAVIQGNERVVRPRLADAKFFFDQDRKKSLEARVAGLDKVVYHNKLGSQGDRVKRVQAIAEFVAGKIGADTHLAGRAALLAKTDLLTDMVGEFPELQGIMGGYYARHDKEDEQVADAIATQYLIRREETQVATNLIAEALTIADRAETLVGIWGIGLIPTGDKDPFALRRHALSIIKSFELIAALGGPYAIRWDRTNSAFELKIEALLQEAFSQFPSGLLRADTVNELVTFIYERYANQLASTYGTSTVESVTHALEIIKPAVVLQEVVPRVKAVAEFLKLPEAPALIAANKRVSNILKKSDTHLPSDIDRDLLKEEAEISLNNALGALQIETLRLLDQNDFTGALLALATLKTPVDAFFDKVMVNVEDESIRANRLLLLTGLRLVLNQVADLSKLSA
ncbi:glycine--tRNA ligase subunit beta [Uliginosibacterium sediminicola]|uniref:Glycine--tRNA ligase beta subunit n=1 Tax=Uliginosibacterium sediminicola TaxID=2024550 RepID=A0ABU9YYW7_9RHOO